jgi:hypothetical protein
MSEIKTQSVINRSVVKAYALKVSAERRAGTFTRVSEDFLVAVEAQVEAAIRQLAPPVESPVHPDDDREFITGRALDGLRERLNARTRAIIQGKVRAHPTLGCTLKD